MIRTALCAAFAAALIAVPAHSQENPVNKGQSSAWLNEQQAALAEATQADGWYTLDGGVKFRRTAGDGTGPAPTVQDTVTVHYTGKLTDGTTFDSSRGRDPATFPLGRLVKAWQIAIPYMGVGDTAEILVPAEMGYGARGAGPIPPASTLWFEIEQLEIED